MMHRMLCALAVGLALTVTAAQAETPSPADAAAITALEKRWHLDADAAWLEQNLDESFVRPMANGRLWSKADQVNWMRQRSGAPPGFSNREENVSVRVFGDTAVVTGLALLINPQGAVVDRNVFTNIYVRRPAGWRLAGAQRTQVAAPPS